MGRFLTADIERGARVDFSKRRLVAVGHSVGATSIIWLQQSDFPIRFGSLIITEPMLNPISHDVSGTWPAYIALAYLKRDTWISPQAAFKDLSKTALYKSWDHQVLSDFVQYGLRKHPTGSHPVDPFHGVTLACSRDAEVALYRATKDLARQMVTALADVSQSTPVHFVWGANEDTFTKGVRQALAEKSGVRVASQEWVPNAGHLVAQQSPAGMAKAIFKALQSEAITASRL